MSSGVVSQRPRARLAATSMHQIAGVCTPRSPVFRMTFAQNLTGRCSSTACSRSNSRRQPLVTCAANNESGRFKRGKPERKAIQPGVFEVNVVSPPPRSLGIYALPPNTHNGEEIEVDGQGYVVTSLVLRYKLVKGKYVRDHNRLDVLPTGRYFLNLMLENLIQARYLGPTGAQD